MRNAPDSDVFSFENGHVVAGWPAEYYVERLANGFASVYHRPSRLTTLIVPATGERHSGQGPIPPALLGEITARWNR